MPQKIIKAITLSKAAELAGQAEIINNIVEDATDRASEVANLLEDLTKDLEEDEYELPM